MNAHQEDMEQWELERRQLNARLAQFGVAPPTPLAANTATVATSPMRSGAKSVSPRRQQPPAHPDSQPGPFPASSPFPPRIHWQPLCPPQTAPCLHLDLRHKHDPKAWHVRCCQPCAHQPAMCSSLSSHCLPCQRSDALAHVSSCPSH